MFRIDDVKRSLKLTPKPVVNVVFTVEYPVDGVFSALDAMEEIERIADEIRGFGSADIVGNYDGKDFVA